jgi:hypothetical protein
MIDCPFGVYEVIRCLAAIAYPEPIAQKQGSIVAAKDSILYPVGRTIRHNLARSCIILL